MLEYVDEIIGSWDKACTELNDGYKAVSGCKRIATAAPDDLFKVDEDAVKLDQARAKAFHNITAKGIYDNKSAMLLETNGRASSSKRTRHIEIWYYYVADQVAKGDLRVVWCPPDEMIADFLTKPLQGKAFVKIWDLLMGEV
jgi:hypothetical protein